jgi:hypothetical protein
LSQQPTRGGLLDIFGTGGGQSTGFSFEGLLNDPMFRAGIATLASNGDLNAGLQHAAAVSNQNAQRQQMAQMQERERERFEWEGQDRENAVQRRGQFGDALARLNLTPEQRQIALMQGPEAGAKYLAGLNRPTTLQRNYDAARAQGFQGSMLDYQTSLRRAGASNTVVNTGGNAQEAFGTQFGKEEATNFFELEGNAQDAVQSLQSAQEARNLLGGDVITGLGADWMLSAGKALQQAGFNSNSDALANTEAFAASRAQEVGRIIKLFGAGTGLSDADRDFATKAAAGQITMTREAITRILDINERAAQSVLQNYEQEASRIQGAYPGINPRRFGVPGVTGAPAGGAAPAQGGGRRRFNPASGRLE